MSHSIVSEPTVLEHQRAAEAFPQTFEAFERQLEAAPKAPPRDDAPAKNDGAPVWRLPRMGSTCRWAESIAHAGVQMRENYLKLSLTAETAEAGTHLIADQRQLVAERVYGVALGRTVDGEAYKAAAIVCPQFAAAERHLKAATAKLEAAQRRRDRLVASPPKSGLGKSLVELDADTAACRANADGCRAEVDALRPAAGAARAALAKQAEEQSRLAHRECQDASLERLSRLVESFYAAHSEELTEIYLASSVRSPERPPDAAALVATLVRHLERDRDGE